MRALSSTAIAEKNKLATTSVFVVLLELTIPGVGTPVPLAIANEDVSWDGRTWQAVPVILDEVGEESKGEVPQVVARIANASRAMEGYLQDYDSWCKTNGFSPVSCKCFVVNTLNLGSSTPESEHDFELLQPKSDDQWAYFVLGAGNPFNRRAPLRRVLRNHCGVVTFKDAECGYAGPETSCNRTLFACRNMSAGSNSRRFNAYPGVGTKGIRVYGP